jgi:2-polyprenyl-3-methyl-5-hydroxy-6-metoxy-1,4-benzoquinol methylase
MTNICLLSKKGFAFLSHRATLRVSNNNKGVNELMSNFHKTAISRRNFSTPVQHLLEGKMLSKTGIILDYGCGRGYDVEHLKMEGFDIEGFDPHGDYNDYEVLDERYDIVMCNFVLNVIEDPVERFQVENHLRYLLKEGGTAYLAVRNDKDVANGCTSTGTWQGLVEPVSKHWELLTSNSKFKLWKYTK